MGYIDYTKIFTLIFLYIDFLFFDFILYHRFCIIIIDHKQRFIHFLKSFFILLTSYIFLI